MELKDEADVAVPDFSESLVAQARHSLAADDHLPGRRPVERTEKMEEGRLSRPTRTRNRDGFPVSKVKIDTGEDLELRPIPADEPLF